MAVTIREIRDDPNGLGFPYGFDLTGPGWQQVANDMWHWCYGRFEDYGPGGSWYVDGPTVWMKDPAEAMEFKLRWM